ncbi:MULTISPECIES: dihydropteroate synthase [Sphingobacterium]|jgi:dihydropteroate synthase|uniref:dihydropteroate synthase n=1 Tax=Sphingobacterium TaxID=28453 RepID=UPI0005F2C018|nr:MULTISPECIES: dihydropteroate synthase [Sphingobacterium]UPZ37432.1 dihydropteroate synthase [Sphingobacterium sp. PCS056]UXD68949.1 dihydropteroate synthase [Sphingobacterium faecium]WGQ16661.1 dihydropteroate synthase [Sphingobacterium faecium]HCU45079.1 dihydropteroate synthase [Sphingobacterium sp.]
MKMIHTTAAQSINLKGQIMTFDRPIIMGILNVTPDSFFDGGQNNTIEQILIQTRKLLEEGADIIDIGAYSSRPGAALISSQEELDRALPAIAAIVSTFPDAILSIDTFRADVAEACIHAGVHLINDVSGGTIDPLMFETVAKLQVPYILMHMRGIPENMQQLTAYQDIVTDVATYFGQKIAALRKLGVKDIILDPGYGFAKTIEQNYELLHRVDELHYFGLPLLGGISRKSMIYKKLGITPQEALNGTTALHTLLLSKGVQLLRVHDVKEAKQIVDLLCS